MARRARRRSCNRIDFQMRDLAAGAGARPTTRCCASCCTRWRSREPVTPRVEGDPQPVPARQPVPAARGERRPACIELDIELLEAALYDLHSRLEALKSAWVQYISGEQKAAARFRELVAVVQGQGRRARQPAPDQAARRDRAGRAKQLPDPYPRQKQFMVIEMASAFLLVESVIDHFSNPAARPRAADRDHGRLAARRGQGQVDRRAARRACAPTWRSRSARCSCAPRWRRRSSPTCSTSSRCSTRSPATPSKRDGARRACSPYLRQIHGALKVLASAARPRPSRSARA